MIGHAAQLVAAIARAAAPERWQGVDETVVERVAVAAGQRPWSVPFAPEGDALLFAFLVAGLVGGFVLGYAYHALFVAPRAGEARRP
jgi:cobalt/nickel transport system permease protein